MSKPVILTGLRANNDLHLGNYLGALLPMVELQKKYAGEYQINLFVPDLHSFTTPIDHSKLYEQTMHNLKLFVAAGLDLDGEDTFIYRQSYIPAHSELTVILNNFTYMGELSRMTQFKEKSDKQDSVSAGLFDYPVLMASDILLYGAKYVPVGDDQTQHVELARDLGMRMNNKLGELFALPEAEKEQIAFASQQSRLRIRDLVDPTKKMSKSDEGGKGVIFLGDTPEAAAQKIMAATTDSLNSIKPDYENQPGVTNLLDILKLFNKHSGNYNISDPRKPDNYKQLKEVVAETVKNFLTDFQKKLSKVDEAKLKSKLEASEKSMNEVANTTLSKVQKAVGLRSQ